MRSRRVSAIARKEFLHILRDPRSLGMAIAIPMLLLVLFGYALTLDVDNVPLAVWDQSGTPASRDLISRFSGSHYFSIQQIVRSYGEIERAIDTREVMAALVIPTDFADRLDSGRPTAVQMLIDGSDANTATIALGYANVVTLTYSQEVSLEAMRRMSGHTIALPLDVRPRVWFNADMESKNYIIPGLTAVIMMIIAALLTSLTIAREWERGTMEQLIATPIQPNELIFGKLLPYFAIGMLDVAIAVFMGEFLFAVPLRGSAALLFGVAAIFLAGALSWGILISIVTRSQLLASQLAMVTTFLPAFLLSGFMYAISNMPVPIQVITHIIPARYFVAILKGIYLKGIGLEILGLEVVFLTVYGVLMVVFANVRLKKRLV